MAIGIIVAEVLELKSERNVGLGLTWNYFLPVKSSCFGFCSTLREIHKIIGWIHLLDTVVTLMHTIICDAEARGSESKASLNTANL